jgi:hypothetical protein
MRPGLQDLLAIDFGERVTSHGRFRGRRMSLTPEGFTRTESQESDREEDRKEDLAQRLLEAECSFVGCAREHVM